jgi:hypothetical protein
MQLEGIPIFEKNYTDFLPTQKHRNNHAFPAQALVNPQKKPVSINSPACGCCIVLKEGDPSLNHPPTMRSIYIFREP